ncbi:hypothetical protein [Flavilitoribacter nigricans]|uniref:Twin-arginine translocation signal domain-containing protein n=1 Tax=Flavilitoribacter nigricans (strain ATCC 23147 / DSM 23189 / NBRC 102662 / NCIMB 1420 / SS-2) TaxID=1122177 RepID=A0A2D0N2D3_FLAN2|nr:hypothetical protein [Flavilitoribacter nigricans]PHN02664.1 hypothetical protein CRP01_31205 [Flavilitoribacter nigricans DSM 23189 = NBRC 102662]
MKRRTFLKHSTYSTAALLGAANTAALAQEMVPAERTGRENTPTVNKTKNTVEVLNPAHRVPVSFIIDDSTALVNMAHYGIPQFAEVFPDNYKQDWRKLPREIPDDFVREFLDWCDSHGVKGKYSMVPYPACTGWLNRFIPGWSKSDLQASIRLVRERAQPNWDIHPEMISHTRVIDIRTGLPFPDATPEFMENWEWSQNKSAEELGEYIQYALNVLKGADLYCEGVTTPGGFAHRNIPNLARGTQWAMQEVYGVDVAHFFRDVITDPGKSVQPQIFHAQDLDTDHASCSVHIIACTGDWFGGWDGLTPGDADRFITADLAQGRMVEVIEQEEPAIFICHWPGIYYNGDKLGFDIFKTVVTRLHQKYDNLIWMKLSEISRYWAAKEFTSIVRDGKRLHIEAPFATDLFTFKVGQKLSDPEFRRGNEQIALTRVDSEKELRRNTWCRTGRDTIVCIDLPKGSSELMG